MEFGERLGAWLKAKGISQKTFAESIEMSRAVVSMWINGRVSPSFKAMDTILDGLGMDMPTFYGKVPKPAKRAA